MAKGMAKGIAKNMTSKTTIRPHEYHDSVRLMQVSEQLRKLDGVDEAILMMATDNNKKLLAAAGIASGEVADAARDDLVIGIVASNETIADAALAQALELLRSQARRLQAGEHRSLETAMAALQGANLALISVPGEYAAEETRKALENGLHVMLFSDNVPVGEEARLKQIADTRGLLLMGPDCGTAIINGCGLGFANAVGRGAVGIVGASGTGIQEISVQLHRCGIGVSHAIGTGGRDLKSAIGGRSMLRGIDMLAADAATEVLVLTSKPPDEDVAERVLDKAAGCGKPVVVNFLGAGVEPGASAGLVAADTLSGAALEAAKLLRKAQDPAAGPSRSDDELRRLAEREARLLSPTQSCLRGLYTGGTLCHEAMLVLRDYVGPVYSNIALEPDYRLHDLSRSRANTLIDMGDDRFTQGRAHPMIDPEQRNRRLENEADDPGVAVVLLDLVLGYGSHEDPAATLAESVRAAKARAADAGRHLTVIASVCGTEQDPQGLARQENLLADAGVLLAASNTEAGRLAGLVLAAAAGRRTGRS